MSVTQANAEDVNVLAEFLSNQELYDLADFDRNGCIVICGSAIFHCFEHVYEQLTRQPPRIRALVLCGGVGHSTSHLYEAIRNSEKYRHHYDRIAVQQKSEAEFMSQVLQESGLLHKLEDAGVRVLVETKSTNCGANATEAYKIMEDAGIADVSPIAIVQDPTMSLRTKACFQKVYEYIPADKEPHLLCYPTFVPRVTSTSRGLHFDSESMPIKDVWEMDRFLDLLLGEIPRLRDDENGYGPKGRGFIPHVGIPVEVENAWRRLKNVTDTKR